MTSLAAIIGDPVSQSLSPAIHNAVFKAMRADWLYLPFLVQSGRLREVFEIFPRFDIVGLSVTMPHKAEVARIVGEIGQVDPTVATIKAANTVHFRPDGSILASNTDGLGCCAAIVEASGADLTKCRVVVIGAGSTAAAVAHALLHNNAKDVAIVNRTVARASELAKTLHNGCRVVEPSEINSAIEQAQIVINTTPVGFNPNNIDGGATESPIEPSCLHQDHIVFDAVYRPLMTPLLSAAQNVGAKIVDGLAMLVHQAALQQKMWLGVAGDTNLMRQTALSAMQR